MNESQQRFTLLGWGIGLTVGPGFGIVVLLGALFGWW